MSIARVVSIALKVTNGGGYSGMGKGQKTLKKSKTNETKGPCFLFKKKPVS
jgi:hypothetical protein